jgi:DNA polymerase III epsilon subunit family exonuclease
MSFTPLDQQRRAIEAPLGPVLVVAGPGAGKTFCLTARIERLIEHHGMAPSRICAVTFTNRAAEEIATRLRHDVTRGTIHALCLTFLREFADAAHLKRGFGVADEQYQHVILGRLRVPQERRGGMLNRFGRHRLQGYELQPDEARIYREYVAWLAARNMVDFDELITRAERLLRENGEIADQIAGRWDYLLVDEFQDVNAVQYDMLKRLASPHGNFFAVGDDEQSIFTWTGADPMVLERFRRDYEAEPVILDKNCRCSRQVFQTARRILAQNPQLFQKQLSADRESPHEVVAHTFRDEDEEANWLVEDIGDARDVAILYRKHRVGELLEGRLLRAGIPCRLARGRSLMEDSVVGYVMTALRIVRNPSDPTALHAFAQWVLSPHFLQEVEAAVDGGPGDFLENVRALARRRPKQDPDTKKLWRLIFAVENLRALPRSHGTLPAVIDEILSQSVGPFRNILEEHHDELTDPAEMPAAVALAETLRNAVRDGHDIVVDPKGGVEIALRGLLAAAGIRRLPSSPAHHSPRTAHIDADALTVFKALQLLNAGDIASTLERFVTFDFETTDHDVATCGVVEIGAARVVNGEIVDRFHALVNPYKPISPRATEIHGYTDADVSPAAPFGAVFAQFRQFVGSDVLIAHNGQHFDIPVLRRLAAGRDGADDLVFYDTLPLARSLSRDRAAQEDLAHRFGIDAGRAHHALDDAVTLAKVYLELEQQRAIRARKAVFSEALGYLGLALALENIGVRANVGGEQGKLFDIARFYTLGRYSDALDFYAMERERRGGTAPVVEDVIKRLGGRALMARLRSEPDPAQRYPAAVARLHALIDIPPLPEWERGSGGEGLNDAIDQLLDRVALSISDGSDAAVDRVNLLTLHSTKGLEFSRVYIAGVEDYEIPGYQASTNHIQDEIEEARRLLYVGMTRAKDRLVLTRAERREGRDTGGATFLEEMGLAPSLV